MRAFNKEQVRLTLQKMAESQAIAIALLEQTLSVLQIGPDPQGHKAGEVALSLPQLQPRFSDPIVDRAMLSIVYRGKSCFLGNTLPFKLFERLSRRPNQFLAYRQLLNEVWDGVVSDAAIRSVVKVLRAKLRAAGMPELAEAIDGSAAGHYALVLNRP